MKLPLLQPICAPDYQLREDCIDILQFSLTELPLEATTLLNEEERVRANRFYFSRHRRRFTVARAMLRAILAKYLSEQPENLAFSYNKYGKPALDNSAQIEFNLSHSGDTALLAVGKKFPLGIDLELFSARPYEDIGKNLFSASEINVLAAQPDNLKPFVFFNIWAQKEAFIKAQGMGLSYPTQKFTVTAAPSISHDVYDELHGGLWKITSFMPTVGCCGALCYSPVVTTLRKIIINPDDFLKKKTLT
ncbi:MAG: 4'-phosphopantetheinyl transferase superfamily protein [Legionella sp.]|nr:4'-phosphopantetheinyl transferase superfamily protein [Legionella sp.]